MQNCVTKSFKLRSISDFFFVSCSSHSFKHSSSQLQIAHIKPTQLNARSLHKNDFNDFELWKSFCNHWLRMSVTRLPSLLSIFLPLNQLIWLSIKLAFVFIFLYFRSEFRMHRMNEGEHNITKWILCWSKTIIQLITPRWWWKIHFKSFKYQVKAMDTTFSLQRKVCQANFYGNRDAWDQVETERSRSQ